MAWPVVRAKMPTSALGNSRSRHAVAGAFAKATRGFTLIEVMVVMAIVGIAMAVVSLALRDPAATRLEREATRLAALLEMARAESRASGLTVRWLPVPAPQEPRANFSFLGLSHHSNLPTRWLDEGVQARIKSERTDGAAPALVLGPQAILDAQSVQLSLDGQSMDVATKGLAAFAPGPATP